MWLAYLLIIYFIPGWIAFFRQCPNRGMVYVLNLFLGWTFFGWVVAFAMACVDKKKAA
jgi:uncharacterized membrane protein